MQSFPAAPVPALRRRLWLVTAAAGTVAALCVVLIGSGRGGGRTFLGVITLGIVAAITLAVAVVTVRAALAPSAAIELGDRDLVLRAPALLRRPMTLPITSLRTVLVDAGMERPPSGPLELTPRFPLVETGTSPAWLHPGARSALPVLGWERSLPNVAIVLRQPLALGTTPRRLVALLTGNEGLRALATCAGFFVTVDASDSLAVDLHDRDLDRPLTLAEAEVLDELATDRTWRS